MRRFRVPEIVLGFLLATAIWLIIFVLQIDTSSRYQICETNQYTGKEQCTPHHILYVVIWYLSYLINATSVTAAATIAIAYFTLNLKRSTDKLFEAGERQIGVALKAAQAAEKNASTAEAALTQLERPYIFIWGIKGFIPSTAYGSVDEPEKMVRTHYPHAEFIYSVSNRGKLTAIIENVSIGCGYGLPALIIIGDHYLLDTPLISSGQDIPNIPHHALWAQLDPATYRAMTIDKQAPMFRDGLTFRVIITYRGPFTQGHETSQCWRYNRSVNGFADVTDPGLTYIR
jgi:hypothetical protein